MRTERQRIVSFDGVEGGKERFSYWLTFPVDEEDDETPPSQRQYDAVSDFYGEGPSSRSQAEYLISAWFYADDISSARNFKLSALRRDLIHIGTAAFLLSDPHLRRKVRDWSAFQWRRPGEAVRMERTTPYRPALQFASDLIDDMRGAGASIFG